MYTEKYLYTSEKCLKGRALGHPDMGTEDVSQDSKHFLTSSSLSIVLPFDISKIIVMVGNNYCNQSHTIFKINDIFIEHIFTKYLLYVSLGTYLKKRRILFAWYSLVEKDDKYKKQWYGKRERRVRGIELGSIEKGSSVAGLSENGTFEQRLVGNEITVDSGQVAQTEVFRQKHTYRKNGKESSVAGAGRTGKRHRR